jgi:hypothetical protein
MRYGAKVLFDEVSTAFTPGKRYGLTGGIRISTGDVAPHENAGRGLKPPCGRIRLVRVLAE